MKPQRKDGADVDREPETKTSETHEKVLQEIAEDARRLKNRYAKETVVPEGGE